MYGCNLFSKNKMDNNKILEAICNAFNTEKENILIVKEAEDWLKRENRPIVLEYNGMLPEDDEEYPKYHYYQLWYDEKVDTSKTDKLDKLLGNDVLVDTE